MYKFIQFLKLLAAGVLISFLRIITKAIYPQDANGLRSSANLYFSVGIVVMAVCIVFHNVAHRLPVIKYYNELKAQAVNEEKEEKGPLTGPVWRATLWDIVGRVKWYAVGIVLIYIVTLSIFPGYITEDVHSEILKDWYSILLITGYNVFDLVGKSLTAAYLLQNEKVAIGGCAVRLLFFPLFYGCLHGPAFFRTEIPVTILTCLLGLTNGYLTSVLMILAPKVVQLQHAETAGIVLVLFLVFGLAIGSVVSWFWVI
jgi:equilibrative nucleoside transporter 1/2/3